MGCRPDISIILIWPDYPVEVGGSNITNGAFAKNNPGQPTGQIGDKADEDGDLYLKLGHAGILLIKGGVGKAQAIYYQYGRYSEGKFPTHQGNVNDYPIDSIILNEDGWPTEESLEKTIIYITKQSGKNTYCHGNVDHLCGEDAYEKAVAFAEAFKVDATQYYDIFSNSCMMFSFKVNYAGGWDWFKSIPFLHSYPADQTDGELGLREIITGRALIKISEKAFSNYVTYDPKEGEFEEHIWQI